MRRKNGGLLNYTTQIEAHKSIAEITEMLAAYGAKAVLTDFDGNGNVSSLTFRLDTKFGQMGFRLPADPDAVMRTINVQVTQKKIPRRWLNNKGQARRVSWRILKDWLEAQLALIKTGQAVAEQVLLAYAVNPNTDRTVYQTMVDEKFTPLLAAPSPVPAIEV
jgi:hypothetical protein